MRPFDEDQLASFEDYTYQGYIPVDHSIFETENTFNGELQVTEEVPDVSTVPRFYIDDLEDIPEEEPDHEYHKPPFEDGPKFIEEPIIRTAFPAPLIAPQPVRATRPTTLNHIFHEPRVVIEEIDIVEPVRVEPIRIIEEKKKSLPIVFNDEKPKFEDSKPRTQAPKKEAEVFVIEPAIAPRFTAPHLATAPTVRT